MWAGQGRAYTVQTGYSTLWPATENPISENNNWRRPGSSVFTNDMRSVGGTGVFGGSGASGVNDAVAVLVGTNYLPNQTATATIYNNGAVDATEMEFHFCVTDTSSTIFLYEFDLVVNGTNSFVNVVKWKGSQGNIYLFSGADILAGTGVATGGVWAHGDVLEASVTGVSTRILQLKQNGNVIIRVQDTGTNSGNAVYTTGNPGIGGDNGGANNLKFGFQNYTVTTSVLA